MKRIFFIKFHKSNAFSLIEVLVSLAIIGIIGVSIFAFQTGSWKSSTRANRTIVAGHLIERQIEAMRMDIDRDQKNNFPPTDGIITENGVTLTWQISEAYRPSDNGNLPNVRKCDFLASWGSAKGDSLKVTTYLSKMF